MRVFFNRSFIAIFFYAFASLFWTSSFAQSTSEPLDLTILSTNEENVQFIVVDEKKQADNEDENTPQEDKRVASDNQSDSLQTETQAALEDTNLVTGDNDTAPSSVSPAVPTQTSSSQETTSKSAEQDNIQADSQPAADSTPKATRIQRRTIKDVGLASIGIDRAEEGLDKFDSLLWRGLSVDKALALIQATPLSYHSDSLRRTSYQVIARQAVPPKGAADAPAMLLDARMAFLARTGRSDGLAEIIRQLPDNEDWTSWKEWQVFYDLMMREDEAACQRASENVKTSLDPLWQKTNLLCQILIGNEAMASFSSDVLKASGLVEDDLFFALIDVLLGRSEALDNASNEPLSLMNMILMDAAHIDISAMQIAELDQSYAKAANALRYMSDEARQSHGMANLRSGLLNSADAKALFLSSMGNVDDPLKAITRRSEDANDLSAVQLYLSLHRAVAEQADAINDNATNAGISELPDLIAQAYGLEMRAGDGILWSSFYAPVMADAIALVDMKDLSDKVQKQYAILSAFSGMALDNLPTDGQAMILAEHISQINDSTAPAAQRQDSLLALDLEDALVLLGNKLSADWLALYLDSQSQTLSPYQALPQTGLKALRQAAANGQQAETILIATILIGAHDLAQLAPSDLAMMIEALMQAGLVNTATALSDEALKAHSLAKMIDYF